MENKSHAFVAGLFTLALGVAVLFAIFWLGGSHEITHNYVVVTKQNVGGLNPQSQVRYRGIRIGKVTDIRLDPTDRDIILISIAIQDSIPLVRSTVAKIGYQGVTGLMHILLDEEGDNDEVIVPDDKNPPRIPMKPSMIETLGETGSETLLQTRELLVNANALLNEENRRRFSSSLAHLDGASSSLKPTLDNLNGTLLQVRKVLDEQNVSHLKQAAAELGPLLADTRVLIGKMQAATDKLDVAIGDPVANGTAALMPRLNEVATEVSQASRQLSRVLRMVEDSPQSLVFGAPALLPGPGEPGFSGVKEK